MPIAIASTVIGIIAGCNKPPAGPGGGMPPPGVTVAEAMARQEPIYLEEIGKAVASESVTIQPQVTGKILAKHFEDGQDVTKGQELFEIDPVPFEAVKAQAVGQRNKDVAVFQNAQSVVNRDTEAMKNDSHALSAAAVDADTASMNEAKAAMDADDASIKAADVNVRYCKIVSPINGKAGVRQQDVGNVVIAAGQGNGTTLLTIQNMTPIYVDFTITEAELLRVRKYMEHGELIVEASLPQDSPQPTGASMPTTTPAATPGTDKPDEMKNPMGGSADGPSGMPTTAPTTMPTFEPRRGKLTFLDNAVQDGSGTVKLRGTFNNKDKHFWPGAFVNVKLILEVQNDAVMIPRQAAQISQTGPFVYIVDGQSNAQIRPIGLGQRYGDLVMINSGLQPGEKVVVTGQQLIQPGGPVSVRPSGPPAGGPGGHS